MTQRDAVLTYLETNGCIDTKTAIKELNWVTRLSEYIRLLRKEYAIESVWQHNESRRWVKYVFKGKKLEQQPEVPLKEIQQGNQTQLAFFVR